MHSNRETASYMNECTQIVRARCGGLQCLSPESLGGPGAVLALGSVRWTAARASRAQEVAKEGKLRLPGELPGSFLVPWSKQLEITLQAQRDDIEELWVIGAHVAVHTFGRLGSLSSVLICEADAASALPKTWNSGEPIQLEPSIPCRKWILNDQVPAARVIRDARRYWFAVRAGSLPAQAVNILLHVYVTESGPIAWRPAPECARG